MDYVCEICVLLALVSYHCRDRCEAVLLLYGAFYRGGEPRHDGEGSDYFIKENDGGTQMGVFCL